MFLFPDRAKTMKRKLLFLRRRHTDTTLGTVLKGDGKQLTKIHPDDALQWSRSFESLILDKSELIIHIVSDL